MNPINIDTLIVEQLMCKYYKSIYTAEEEHYTKNLKILIEETCLSRYSSIVTTTNLLFSNEEKDESFNGDESPHVYILSITNLSEIEKAVNYWRVVRKDDDYYHQSRIDSDLLNLFCNFIDLKNKSMEKHKEDTNLKR